MKNILTCSEQHFVKAMVLLADMEREYDETPRLRTWVNVVYDGIAIVFVVCLVAVVASTGYYSVTS